MSREGGRLGHRVAVVTGATSGLGLETARGLAAAGWQVVLACRDVQAANGVRDELAAKHLGLHISVTELDLASFASIRACAEMLIREQPAVHLLVNNAGVFCDTGQRTQEGFERTVGVNFLGTMLLTRLLLPLVRATAARDGNARVVFVSSAAAAFGKLRKGADRFETWPHGFRGYAGSKLAQVHLVKALALELAGSGVTVNAVHPGDAATNIWRGESLLMRIVGPLMKRRLRSPALASSAILHAALAEELSTVSGAFLGVKGERLEAARYDDAVARADLLAAPAVALQRP